MEHDDVITALAIDPTGNRLASGAENGWVQVWQLNKTVADSRPEAKRQPHSLGVNSIAFDDEGKWMVTSGNDGAVFLWNLEGDNEPVMLFQKESHFVTVVLITSDGRWLIGCTGDGQILLWDLPRCRVVKRACDEADVDPNEPSSEPGPLWEA